MKYENRPSKNGSDNRPDRGRVGPRESSTMEEVLRKGVRVDFSRSNQIRNGVVGRQRNSVKPLWYKYSTEPKLLKIQTHHVGPLKTKI